MTDPTILQNATLQQLEQAVAYNHKELFRQEAIALGGDMLTNGGLDWTSGTAYSASMVAFPDLSAETAGARLDELLSFYLLHPPRGAGCWSLDPSRPVDLGVRLLARGFQPGWRPHWMALDLDFTQTHHPFPKGLEIVANNGISLATVRNLPYAQVVVPLLSSAAFPGQWVRFVASFHGRVVAHSVVFLTIGEWGVAGIYHVGVVPRARHKGIGKAITLAACLYAREKGYRYAVLNSTAAGKRTYGQLGFSALGDGLTWWLIIDRLLARPPTSGEVRLAEAIGRGDLQELSATRPFGRGGDLHWPEDLNRPLTNGMTLMQLAVHCRQPLAAEWLLEGGAAFSALDAWDLQWKDRANQLLRTKPGQIDQRYGEENKTLLHIAAERNDEELALLALSANPDLRLKDKTWQSTALDWAKHLGHLNIARLIGQHKK
jgi:GNAT superfamily N-acetyltransferase